MARRCRLHAEHDLADVNAGFHMRMCLGGFPERKDAVHYRAYLAGRDKWPDIALDRLRDRSFVRDRPRAPWRAGVMQSLGHDAPDLRRPRSNTLCQPVKNVSGIAAASAAVRPLGIGSA